MRETPLTIYHASAGTGKTFTLVKDYLALILGDTNDFRHILAVTFAVKAATEMKDRILRVLYGLTKVGLSEYEDTPEVKEAHTYLQHLPEAWRKDQEQIRKKARRALRLMLYEYPAFSVQTIDSFFQRVLRSFARELNLPFAFEMEFDQKEVLKEIIDLLLIQAGDDPVLLSWLIRMMEELGEDSGNWDVRKLLMQEGEEIFTETFKSLRRETLDQLTDRDLLRDYLGLLAGIITSFEKTLERLGQKGLELFQHHDVNEDDFSGKSKGVAGIFRKMIKGRDLFNGESPFKKMFMAALEDPEKWLRAEQRKEDRLLSLVNDHLQPLIREIYDFYRQNARQYFTARVLRKRLYTLGIMADLRRQLFVWMQEQNRFLISETGTFLHEIMGENEIPFIYEKTGQHFLYYMIDEFQDTSRVQYEDLLPLLRNSMALGGPSLIVGDIKQSLYRWRNGDWEIMHRDIYRDLGLSDAVKKRLQVNYRSREEIVRFNNAFFMNAGETLWQMYREDVGDVLPDDDSMLRHQQEILFSIYAEEEVRQEVPEQVAGGYVAVRLVEGVRKDAWHQEALEQSAQLIDDLIGREGWPPGAVMLLVRSNKDGREVVRYLLERQHRQPDAVQYPVVSKESLYLSASPAIRFLITFLRYLTDPADTLNFAELWHLQERLHPHGEDSSVPPLHEKILEEIPPVERIFLFLDRHDQPWLSRLSALPLPEVVQEVTHHFRLQEHREDIPFLHTFQNFLTEFVNREGSDAVAFLEWWEETGWKRSVQLPEEVDAVKVLTIHTAKGLGAPVVIMPFADWKFENASAGVPKVLWCHPPTEPFNKIPLVPVEYTRKNMLLNSYFAEDYLKEHFSNYLDNLNLLYVACTRARERLYLFAPKEKEGPLAKLLRQTLEKISCRAEEMSAGTVSGAVIIRKEEDLFEAGTRMSPAQTRESRGVEVDDFPAEKALGRLRVAGKGREYFLLEKGGYRERIDRGTLYHTILAGVMVKGDVATAVKKAVRAGMVPAEEREPLTAEIASFLEQPGAGGWFDGSWQVRTEAEIILPGGKTLRPDRVMIRGKEVVIVDYKFGEVEEEHYLRQIRQYMEVMKKMGYEKVSGVIWYVTLQKMIKVDE